MKTVIGIAAIVASAGIAGADLSSANGAGAGEATNNPGYSVDVTTSRIGNVEFDITFDNGVNFWDGPGSANNVVLMLDLAAMAGAAGTQVDVTGIGWDVSQEAFGASWLSEQVLLFDTTTGFDANAFNLTVSGTAAPGTESNSSPVIKLNDAGLGNLILVDGILIIEFFESFDDITNEIDGRWLAGSSITIQANAIPAPGAFALLGLGGLAAARRRR